MTYQDMMSAILKATGKDGGGVGIAMANALDLWAAMYEDRAPWLSAKQGVQSAGVPMAVCAELARLATCELVTAADDETVNTAYQQALGHVRGAVEQCCALGGTIFKPYINERGGVTTQTIRADRYFPLTFDSSGTMTEVALVEQLYIGKDVFTRLEIYSLIEHLIYNLAFRRPVTGAAGLGMQVYLDSVPQWQGFAEVAGLHRDVLPFGVFKYPLANTIDVSSPMGMSVYGRAVELIREADKRYSNVCWEYEAKQAAVHIASSMLRRRDDGTFEYPNGKARLYHVLEYNIGATDKPLIDVYSPDIRADALISGYQAQLKLIEFSCGLAYGTISDPQETARTATEVRASKQRLYVTVTDIQRALEAALKDTAQVIAELQGKAAAEISFDWGDSVMTDADAFNKQTLLEYQSGVIDRIEYYKRVYEMTDEQAAELAQEIDARAKDDGEPDLIGFGRR